MTGMEQDTILRFITSQIAKKKKHQEIGDKDDLIATGIIDSLGIIKLVGFLEATFGIRIRDEDLLPENFSSVSAIAAFVGKNR